MSTPLKVLIVEDTPADAELMIHELRRADFEPTWSRVEHEQAYLAQLDSSIDVVLADYTLPQFDCLTALRLCRDTDLDVPFVVVSARVGEEEAVECLRQGATDYVHKDRLGRLGPTVQRALGERDLRTQRRESEQALRDNERLLRTILENLPVGVRIIDRAGHATYHNPEAARIWGSSGQLAPLRIRDHRAWWVRSGELIGIDEWPSRRAVDEGKTSLNDEIRIECLDGSHKIILSSALPLRDEGQHVVGAVVVIQDITTRRRAEAELQQAQKLESVGLLAAGIAHEINTPIQFVGDNMHFLRDAFSSFNALLEACRALCVRAETEPLGPDLLAELAVAEVRADLAYLQEEIPRAVDQTLDGIARVASIVRAMKDFAHPDDKNMSLADINHALQSTLTVARNELKYVAEVQTDLGDLPPVLCHLGDLNQVFLNLLVNAAHAIADRPDRTDLGKIEVTTRRDGSEAVITISDTGCGISEEIQGKVFDQFFTTKAVGRGTGQGLAMARAVVVERHRGSLTFTTTPGAGTTFTVRLPIGGPPGGRLQAAA